MTQPRCRLDMRTILRVAGDVRRFVWSTLRPHAQLAAENLFLRKQLALYLDDTPEMLADRHGHDWLPPFHRPVVAPSIGVQSVDVSIVARFQRFSWAESQQ